MKLWSFFKRAQPLDVVSHAQTLKPGETLVLTTRPGVTHAQVLTLVKWMRDGEIKKALPADAKLMVVHGGTFEVLVQAADGQRDLAQ